MLFARWIPILSLVTCLAAVSANAQIVTLTDGNSIAQINPNSQAGMFYWGVLNSPGNYQNQLSQQWFWYRVGSTDPERSIDTLSAPVISGLTASTLTTTYFDSLSRFNITITYTLQGGAAGSGTADISEQIRINNTSGGVLPFHFFQYSDFNMAGDPANDSGFLSRNGFTMRFNQVDQMDGANIVETVVTPNANHGETDTAPNSLNRLNDLFATTLDDTKTNASGNIAWALEWDKDIAAGGSLLISKDKHLEIVVVPEPSSLALLSLGAVALAVRRRQRSK